MSDAKRTRGNRQRLRGVVVRDKAAKTITVEVTRQFRHPRYGKIVRRHTRIAAHDPAEEAHVGDLVEIVASRPFSKTKRFRLFRVLERGYRPELVGQPPARPEPVRAPAAEPSAEAEPVVAPPAEAGPEGPPQGPETTPSE